MQKTRCRPAQGQLIADGVAHKIVQPRRLAKTHFGLGRVNVDIHLLGRHLHKQQHHGKGRGRKNIAVGLAHRVHEQAIAHQPAIDEAVDGVAIEFLKLRLGSEAGDAQRSRLRLLVVGRPSPRRRFGQPGVRQLDFGRQGQQLIQCVLAEDLEDALRRLAHRRRHQQRMRGGVQLEVLVRVGERVMRNQRGYVR